MILDYTTHKTLKFVLSGGELFTFLLDDLNPYGHCTAQSCWIGRGTGAGMFPEHLHMAMTTAASLLQNLNNGQYDSSGLTLACRLGLIQDDHALPGHT